MIKIYFDDNLVNEDFYSNLSNDFELFGTSFKLGTTASNKYNLSVGKEVLSTGEMLDTVLNTSFNAKSKQPTEVKIYDDTILIATLVVDNITENDYSYTYILTDKMVNLEFYYDASEIFTNGSATLLEIALDICNKAGIELATQNFRGYNKKITWYDNSRTAREYIGYMAELNGGYAQIGTDGRLYFIKQKTDSVKDISIDDCENFVIGEKKKITRVVFEQGALKYDYGDETGNTLYLNEDNVFITEENEVAEIYEDIKDFTFYNFETTNCPIDFNIRAGNIITFVDTIGNKYPTIVGYELTYNADWYGGYSLDVESSKQEETQIVSAETKIKNLQIKVDRDSNKITQVIKEIGDNNEKISQVTQTVDNLNSKISDVADITKSNESIYASVDLESINQSEPIYIKIHPINGENNISYLYPRNNLYPSDTLYPKSRTLRFDNTITEEYFDYELPDDLLFCDGIYDEFVLDYDKQSCLIIKKVGYNEDGSTYILNEPQTTEYDFPHINITDGNYTIRLLGYNAGYLFVKLMAQNIYTTQFATKAEVSSEISQTEQDITLSVDKKLTDYSTTAEMNSTIKVTAEAINSTVSKKVGENEIISKINQSAEKVTIDAEKLNINGAISANGNFSVSTTGNMTCKNASIEGGSISLTGGTKTSPKFQVTDTSDTSIRGYITPSDFNVGGGSQYLNFVSGILNIYNGTSSFQMLKSSSKINAGVDNFYVSGTVHANAYNYDSLESLKKNIAKLNMNALEVVQNSELYKFNYNSEKNTDKQHIGFIIGNKGGDYKTPDEVIANSGEGIDSYTMASVLWKAVQELVQMNRELEERIKRLEE